jgi:hypothetical protein
MQDKGEELDSRCPSRSTHPSDAAERLVPECGIAFGMEKPVGRFQGLSPGGALR